LEVFRKSIFQERAGWAIARWAWRAEESVSAEGISEEVKKGTPAGDELNPNERRTFQLRQVHHLE
jgi:hypothetical protein